MLCAASVVDLDEHCRCWDTIAVAPLSRTDSAADIDGKDKDRIIKRKDKEKTTAAVLGDAFGNIMSTRYYRIESMVSRGIE